jgi:hypothetical protein
MDPVGDRFGIRRDAHLYAPLPPAREAESIRLASGTLSS